MAGEPLHSVDSRLMMVDTVGEDFGSAGVGAGAGVPPLCVPPPDGGASSEDAGAAA